MAGEELRLAIHKTILKVHVITGWILPTNDFLDILLEQFELKILESYSNINSNEIEHAFRSNAEIKDWGHNMNLNLIDEVVRPYLSKRFELSAIEEKIKNQNMPVQKIYTEEQMLNECREKIELAFRAMKKGRVILTLSHWKPVLIADGLMKEEETLADFFSRRLATSEQIYVYE